MRSRKDVAAGVYAPPDGEPRVAIHDGGDRLHPSDKGAEAMANAVDTSLLEVQP